MINSALTLYKQDFFYPYSGTSAACPSATGALALLAQARADAHVTGKLGWLNPLLYKLGAEDVDNAFNDVTEGSNNYCGQDNGFSAAKG